MEPTLKEIATRAACDVRSVRKWRSHDPGLRKLVRARIERAAKELRIEMKADEINETNNETPPAPKPEPGPTAGYYARITADGRLIESNTEV